jgi:hypothetical protein
MDVTVMRVCSAVRMSSSKYLLALHDLNDSFFILNISPRFGSWQERVKQCELMRIRNGGEVCLVDEETWLGQGAVERRNKSEREMGRVVE